MNIAPSHINFNLLRAFEGLRNRRAILLLIGAHLLGFVVFAIGMSTNSVGVAVVLGVVGFLVTLFGVNAAGVVLMDAARGTPLPTIADAIYAGVASFFKIIAISIVALVAFGLYWVALYVVFLICRIPGIGPLIYAVALPAAIVLTTFVLLGYTAASCIVVPAVWEGHTLRAAIARLYAVATHRPMEVFVQLLILWFVLALISIVVFGFLTSSSFLVGGVSVAALADRVASTFGRSGVNDLWEGALSGMAGMAGRSSDGGGYIIAGIFGIAIVWVLGVTAYASVFLMGINLVYLSASEGIDSSAAEAKLAQGLAQAKQKASQMQEHAKQRAWELQERARHAEEQRRMAAQAAAAGAGAAGVAPSEAGARCPGCGAVITGSDAFCGDCGQKLR